MGYYLLKHNLHSTFYFKKVKACRRRANINLHQRVGNLRWLSSFLTPLPEWEVTVAQSFLSWLLFKPFIPSPTVPLVSRGAGQSGNTMLNGFTPSVGNVGSRMTDPVSEMTMQWHGRGLKEGSWIILLCRGTAFLQSEADVSAETDSMILSFIFLLGRFP